MKRNTKDSGVHRSKRPKPTRKLADEPEMKALANLIESGKLNRERTTAYLMKGQKP